MSNRLAAEQSPYLRQHAENPVDWLPWGDEAFARARAGQRPIFLSIGYSTCHWCHVMAHESFENPDVAAILNRDFVPVKLDREERPDLDRVYMAYVQQTTGHGGWPMSVWLTPDLKPFYGGTYFPPDDRQGRPGLITVLNAITRHWQEKREKIVAGADEAVGALQRVTERPAHADSDGIPDALPLPEAASEAMSRAFQSFHGSHDVNWGGFGGAPKFPRPSVINFIFRAAALQGPRTAVGEELLKLAAFTLRKMAEGGLQDHIGGGFHRYSVDERWFVPHFEKMLYDQAQLALNYLDARQATGLEAYGWVARDIFAYVQRDLTGPHGEFYSAEDADSASGGDERSVGAQAEGAFYVWTQGEIESALGKDAAFLCAHYGVKPGGNVDQDPQGEFAGKNILMQRQSLATTARDHGLDVSAASETLVACLAKLRAVRNQRPRPHLDNKVIAAWNGLMISALARGSRILGEQSSLAAATRAAEFLRRELFDEKTGTLFRSWCGQRSAIQGFAEDYAFLIQGLLDLYEAGFDIRWLQWAEQLQASMERWFADETAGGYFNSRADDSHVILRMKEDHDGAEPSANSIAALNLLRLDAMLGEGDMANATRAGLGYRERALRTIEALRPQWSTAAHALPQLLCAFELALDAPRTVVLAGDPATADFQALAAVLWEKLGPWRSVVHADGGTAQRWLAVRRSYLAELKPVGGRATAYVCEGFTCQAPATDPATLRSLLV